MAASRAAQLENPPSQPSRSTSPPVSKSAEGSVAPAAPAGGSGAAKHAAAPPPPPPARDDDPHLAPAPMAGAAPVVVDERARMEWVGCDGCTDWFDCRLFDLAPGAVAGMGDWWCGGPAGACQQAPAEATEEEGEEGPAAAVEAAAEEPVALAPRTTVGVQEGGDGDGDEDDGADSDATEPLSCRQPTTDVAMEDAETEALAEHSM